MLVWCYMYLFIDDNEIVINFVFFIFLCIIYDYKLFDCLVVEGGDCKI